MKAEIEQFWNWFRARGETIQDQPSKHAPEISEMVRRIHPGLSWEMGKGVGPDRTFVVRSEDSKVRFLAHKTISRAPMLRGWTFSAWRLPDATPTSAIQLQGGRTFKLSEFSADFDLDSRYPILKATLNSPAFRDGIGKVERFAARIALDSLLGERQVLETVDSIELRVSPPGRTRANEFATKVGNLLQEARSRLRPQASDEWAVIQGDGSGTAMLGLLLQRVDLSKLPLNSWNLEVGWTLHHPLGSGSETSAEVDQLRSSEEAVVSVVEKEGKGVVWGHMSINDRRVVLSHVQDPIRIEEEMVHLCLALERQPKVELAFDPRWTAYRAFLS